MQGESADTESGQFYCVQQSHLGHTIGFCATTGPVLVTLNLEVRKRERQMCQLQNLYHSLLNGVSINGVRKNVNYNTITQINALLINQAYLWIKTPGCVVRYTSVASLCFTPKKQHYAN